MKETLSEARAKAREDAEAIRKAAKKYSGMRCSDRPDIYGGTGYGQLRRQTIWQKIRGIFRR
jgi:hypothetical protein